jgi:hypothetical protein
MSDVIINKVAESGIITINLEDYYPKEEIVVFDLKSWLFKDLILKEKDFRDALKVADWEQYRNKYVALTNTADAIIPMWAYMLVTSYLQSFAKEVVFGDENNLVKTLILRNIGQIETSNYTGKRIVIKGCGDIAIPEAAYVAVTNQLKPVVKSLMFGEACSTVPVYKAALTQAIK